MLMHEKTCVIPIFYQIKITLKCPQTVLRTVWYAQSDLKMTVEAFKPFEFSNPNKVDKSICHLKDIWARNYNASLS